MATLTWEKVEERINNGEKYFRDIHIFTANLTTMNLIKEIFFENCIIYMDYVNKIDNCTFKNCKIKNIYGCTIIKTLFDSCDIMHTNIKHGESYNSLFARCNFYNSKIHNYKIYNCEFYISSFFHSKIENSIFCDCDFSNSNFYNAMIKKIEFINPITDKGTTFLNLSCPEEGAFIAYKKVNNHLIKLIIPSDAKRSSATTLKCRCSYAKVLEITNLFTNENVDSILNKNTYGDTLYKVNEFVYPDSWDDNRWNERSHGIHFFINKNNAINY